MATTIHVRPATADDAETIVDFNLRMAEETEGKSLRRELLSAGVRQAVGTARARYFVACRGDAVIGQLMLTQEWSDWRNGDIWWIQSVYVPAEHRRGGVFRALYEHVEGEARRSGSVVGLRLYVEQENVVAQQTYERMGMRRAGYIVYERMFDA